MKQTCNFCSVYVWRESKKCKCINMAELWTTCNKYDGWLHCILVRCGRAAEWTEQTGTFEGENKEEGKWKRFAKTDEEGNGDITMWHIRYLAGCCSSVNMAGRLRGWSSRMAGCRARYEHCEMEELGVSESTYEYIYDLTHVINMIDWLSVSSMKLLSKSSQKDWLMCLQYVPGRNKWNVMPTFQLWLLGVKM
jgi:hypothetical protein